MFSRSVASLRTNVVRSTKRFSSSESSGSAGSTVTSKGGFSDKERAAETQWARAHDAEKLKLLREELNKHKKVTEDLEQKVNELSKK